jgi:hypothetical protein
MGQAGNSNRRASLDDQKERAAGRRGEREMIKNTVMPRDAKGKTGGAFGSGTGSGSGPGAGARRPARPARQRKA